MAIVSCSRSLGTPGSLATPGSGTWHRDYRDRGTGALTRLGVALLVRLDAARFALAVRRPKRATLLKVGGVLHHGSQVHGV
jgi:hypothetical protein